MFMKGEDSPSSIVLLLLTPKYGEFMPFSVKKNCSQVMLDLLEGTPDIILSLSGSLTLWPLKSVKRLARDGAVLVVNVKMDLSHLSVPLIFCSQGDYR